MIVLWVGAFVTFMTLPRKSKDHASTGNVSAIGTKEVNIPLIHNSSTLLISTSSDSNLINVARLSEQSFVEFGRGDF